MENKAHFGSLTPRMAAYRESVLEQKPYIDAQRAVLATEVYKKNLHQPAVMKRALMLKNILEHMDIYIEDETILAGNQSSVNRGAPVFPEYTMKFILDELDLFEKRDGMDEALEVMKLGTGMPAFNNDEVIIPSFIEKGVKKEDAYDYSAVGCVETAVPGKWGYRCTGMSYMNFPRILLMAMNRGVDMTSGKRFTKDYGDFRNMQSFDELMRAWDNTVRELTRASVIVENAIDLASEREVPDILCSTLTRECLGRGKTIKEGGSPTHSMDKNGPTAVFKSVSKLPPHEITEAVCF